MNLRCESMKTGVLDEGGLRISDCGLSVVVHQQVDIGDYAIKIGHKHTRNP